MAGGTSGLAPRAGLRGCVPVRYAAREAPPAPARTCTLPGSGWQPPRAPRRLLTLSALRWSGLGEDGSPSVSWRVTVSVRLCGRRAAAVPCPKSAWETIPGSASVCTSQNPGSSAGMGPAGPPGTGGLRVLRDQSPTSLCAHQPVGAHGTGRASCRRSRRGCPPLARLEESGWGSAPGFASLPLREPGRHPASRQALGTGAARSAAALPSAGARPNPSPRLPLSGHLTPSKNSYSGVEHGRSKVLALHKPQGFDLWRWLPADEIHPPAFFNIVSWQLSWFLC